MRSEITSVSRVAHVLLLRFVAGNMDVNTPAFKRSQLIGNIAIVRKRCVIHTNSTCVCWRLSVATFTQKRKDASFDLWPPLHDRGFNDFCVTWNKGVRRMLNVSNMTHTALLGEMINTCHISIQLVKRFCKFVDLMLTSCNAIVRHFVRRAINSAQSPIGRNIAVIRHRYAICVVFRETVVSS